MSYEHKNLALGRWKQLSFMEQMANIGSEVERAFNWRVKDNPDYAKKAFERALELIGLTLENITCKTHLKEVARLREVLLDFFWGSNEFNSTENSLRDYFLSFAHNSCKNR